MESFDVAIVGAGPIGVELAVGLKREGVRYVQFDSGQVGSTIEWYAPGTTFFSSPERIALAGVPLETEGQRKATREEYLAHLRSVVRQFGLRVRTYEEIVSIRRTESGRFELRTRRSARGFGSPGIVESRTLADTGIGESTIAASKVVLAIGDMHRPNFIGVPGEDLPHVSHYFQDPHRYFGTRVLIVGGKNSAAEAALRLHRLGASVALSYRGAAFDSSRIKYWILPELEHLIRKGEIAFFPGTTPSEIRPEYTLLRGREGERPVEADFVLLLTGYRQDPSLYESAGVILEGDHRAPRYSSKTMETNVPGLYVAGTGIAGSQVGGVKEFIETSHVHVDRILAALLGREAPPEESPRPVELVES